MDMETTDMTEELVSLILNNHLIHAKILTFLPFHDVLAYSCVNRHWSALCRKELRNRTCAAGIYLPKQPRYSICLAMKEFNDMLKDSADPPFSGILLNSRSDSTDPSSQTCSPSCFNKSEEEDPDPLESLFTSLRKAPNMWKWVVYVSDGKTRCPAVRAFRQLFVENLAKVKYLNFLCVPIDKFPGTFQQLTQYAKSELAFPNLEFWENTTVEMYMRFRDVAPKWNELTSKDIYFYEKPGIVPLDFYARLAIVNLDNYLEKPESYKNCRAQYANDYINRTDSLERVSRFEVGILNVNSHLNLNERLCRLTSHVLNVAFMSLQNVPPFVNLRTVHFWFVVSEEQTRLEKLGFQYINFGMFPRLENVSLYIFMEPEGDCSTVVQFQELRREQQVSRTVTRLDLEDFDFKIRGLPFLAYLFPNVKHMKLNMEHFSCADQQSRDDLFLNGHFKALESLQAYTDHYWECPAEFVTKFFGAIEKSIEHSKDNLVVSADDSAEDLGSQDLTSGVISDDVLLNPAIFHQTQLKKIILHIPHRHRNNHKYSRKFDFDVDPDKYYCQSFAVAAEGIRKLLSDPIVEYIREHNSQLKIIFRHNCTQCDSLFDLEFLKPKARVRSSSNVAAPGGTSRIAREQVVTFN